VLVFGQHAVPGEHAKQPVERRDMRLRRAGQIVNAPWSIGEQISEPKRRGDGQRLHQENGC